MLGGFLGAGNGYLLIGTLWYFLHLSDYPVLKEYILPPEPGTPAGDAALKIIELLPPTWLQGVTLYVAAAIALAFVIIVFI